MYSILIKTSNAANKFSYYLNSDETVFVANTLEVLQDKIIELLGTYTLKQIIPVKNCKINQNITVEEMEG